MNDTTSSDPTSPSSSSKSTSKLGCFLVPIILLATLLPLWFFFIGPKLRHDRLVKNGISVSGRLLDVEETGTVVNDSPELELTVEFTRKDGQLDTASCDFVPSLRSLHMFQPGIAVKAAYDPEDPEEITVVELGSSAPEPTGGQGVVGVDVDSLKRAADSMAEELRKMKGE